MKELLSKVQTRELLSLGIEPSRASCRIFDPTGNQADIQSRMPIFRLVDMLRLLPGHITVYNELTGNDIEYTLTISAIPSMGSWQVEYISADGTKLYWSCNPELIDSIFHVMLNISKN